MYKAHSRTVRTILSQSQRNIGLRLYGKEGHRSQLHKGPCLEPVNRWIKCMCPLPRPFCSVSWELNMLKWMMPRYDNAKPAKLWSEDSHRLRFPEHTTSSHPVERPWETTSMCQGRTDRSIGTCCLQTRPSSQVQIISWNEKLRVTLWTQNI